MKENWFLRNHQTEDIVSSVLRSREVNNIDKFLNPTLDKCSDPNLLSGARKAARKILTNIQEGEKITIFGHDDVDGITSTVVLYKFLEKIGAKDIAYYIPNREVDKFGLRDNFIQKVLQDGTKRVITVDIGVTETAPIARLRRKGIKTIIIDHHKIMKEHPQASAIVDPHKKNDRFPFKYLAGVGVVWNVVKILSIMTGVATEPVYPLLAGLGTIADRMPLIDDNRIYAKHLYYNFEQCENRFFHYYAGQTQGIPREISVKKLIPLLTMGRHKDGRHLAVDILLSKDENEIDKIYKILEDRIYKNEHQVKLVKDLIESEYQKQETHFFIYCDPEGKIPSDYLGVATSYITDTYRIPSLVMTKWEDDVLTAEARAPLGFNWLDCLKKIEKYLIQYGGHKEAAGFTCHKKYYKQIRDTLEKLAEGQYKNIQKLMKEHSKIYIDYVLDEDQLVLSKLREIHRIFAPFGEGNPPLVYLLIYADAMELKEKGFVNFPEEVEGSDINVTFSIINDTFTITDYEKVSVKRNVF
ncbi:MAG: DHH family phosphoesterase [Candidatus Cloacimonetes bacterium]|nr:DHH family phosphoesterase [Candidatus Cloacimonadota bacterium]